MTWLVILSLSGAPNLPIGVSCDMIRDKVAEHGKIKAIIWARQNGYSWSQIGEARKCLLRR